MEYRKRREAKGRPISTRRGEAAPYLASRASGAAIHSNVHVSLSAMIGDGRHISSEARTRPLFAARAAAQVCLTEYRKRVRQGSHIATRRGERGHLFAVRASGAAISFFTFLIPCSA